MDDNYTSFFITSGDGDYPGCRLSIGGRSFPIPAIIKPHVEKKQFTSPHPDFIARLGRDWYIETNERRLGFSYLKEEGYLSVWLMGKCTNNIETDQTISFSLPWKQWKFVYHRVYGLDGELFWTSAPGGNRWDEWEQIDSITPKRRFAFKDFDGEEIEVSTYIEEREWHKGESWCRWLSLFTPPKVQRSLDLRFSKETGERKGSWKGGILGTGIEMLPGELHEEAFKRYCDKNGMTFVAELN